MYDALVIAQYIISKCFKEDHPVSNLRLQKLLYFVQLESYKKYRKPLFFNDIAAWQFGPVVPDVYYQYNMYGGAPILLTYYNLNIDKRHKQMIKDIINKYKNYAIWEIVRSTHKEDSPWDITIKTNGIRATISEKLLKREAGISI